MWPPARLSHADTPSLAMCRLPVPGLPDGRDGAAQHEAAADGLVLAAYLMTTDTRGISALLLQRQLGLRRYETAWMLRHKLRRAMVNVAREPLHGEVEIDDTGVGGPQPGLRGSRQLKGRKAAIVLVAAEKRGRGSGRIRMAMAANFKQTTMRDFVKPSRGDGLHRRPERLRGVGGCRREPRAPDSTAQKRPAERHPVGGASGGPRDWDPAAVADRHVPWSQQGTASGLPR